MMKERLMYFLAVLAFVAGGVLSSCLLDFIGFPVSDLPERASTGAVLLGIATCAAFGEKHPKIMQWATDTFWGVIILIFGLMFAVRSMTYLYCFLQLVEPL